MQKKDLDKLPEEDGGWSPGQAGGATTDLHFVHPSARKTTLVHNIGADRVGAQKTGARYKNLWTQHWRRVVHGKDSRATLVKTELVLKKLTNSKICDQHLYISEFLMENTADCFRCLICLEPSWRRGRVA